MRFVSASRSNKPVRAAEPTGPIAASELPALFAPVETSSRIALAVSGGADSLALLDCADRWRKNTPGAPDLLVLTVDHGLRASSRREAAAVVALARARGIEAKLLRWTGRRPTRDIEAAARAARYRLLLSAAEASAATHLLIAHHRDDQAETLLLRLARGSGLFGLAAMRSEIRVGDVTISRPFLHVSRERLRATAAAAGMHPVEDPMNADDRFARSRIRRLMPLLAAEGVDPSGLAATARRLAGAAEAVDRAAGDLLASAVTVDALAVATLHPSPFFAAPGEVRTRALVRILLAIGGDLYPPRYDRLAALLRDIEAHAGGFRFKRTLAGTVVEARKGNFVIFRETGREGLPDIAIRSGFSGVWDHRFHVEALGRLPRGLRLAALGAEGRRAASIRKDSAPYASLEALPAFWLRDRLFCVPSLGFTVSGAAGCTLGVQPILAARLAEPPRFPDFLASG